MPNKHYYLNKFGLSFLFNNYGLILDASIFMMTSSNGNIFRVTGHLCGKFTGLRWFPHKGQWRGALMFFFYLCLNKRLRKHSWGGNLRRYCAHYGVIAMFKAIYISIEFRLPSHRYIYTNIKMVPLKLHQSSTWRIQGCVLSTFLGKCIICIMRS